MWRRGEGEGRRRRGETETNEELEAILNFFNIKKF
jgi:hypothetical protein